MYNVQPFSNTLFIIYLHKVGFPDFPMCFSIVSHVFPHESATFLGPAAAAEPCAVAAAQSSGGPVLELAQR